eukprot:3184274-Pyramimonas_sp.AAC.1
MAVLLRDAKSSLGDLAGLLGELVYADDAPIVATAPGRAEQRMQAGAMAGASYGLTFNRGIARNLGRGMQRCHAHARRG